MAAYPVQHPVVDRDQGVDLTGLQGVEEEVPHTANVIGRGGFDGPPALIGEHDERAAPVGAALLPDDQPAFLHSLDLVGEPAAVPEHPPSEITRAQPASGAANSGMSSS